MKWSQLLSDKRLGGEIVIDAQTESRYPRSEFEKDYRRIIESASFRRLQDKTQVFPLDQSDFVRTRLTHSYEAAALAKTMGVMLLTVLREKKSKEKRLDEADWQAVVNIPDILNNAGLLHDIGNPPFGHFGEEIIQKWFASRLKAYTIRLDAAQEVPLESLLDERQKADLLHFDGNAQALRVLTRLHFQDGDDGLNLTAAVLNTLIKYPTASVDVRSKAQTDYCLLNKKMGYTEDDRETFKRVIDLTGAVKGRHPLAFLLEAADDIAYKTADIEDGFKKGLFSLDALLDFAGEQTERLRRETPEDTTLEYVGRLFGKLNLLREEGRKNPYRKAVTNADLYAIQNWVPYAHEWLMFCAVFGFDKHYAAIMEGGYAQDLFHETNHARSVDIIDEVMKTFIFPNRSIVKLELAADTILSDLLDKFTRAALYHDEQYISSRFVEIKAYKKLYGLVSDNYRQNYARSLYAYRETHPNAAAADLRAYDLYARLLLVVDYVSGMTDSYAKSLYQELNGIYGLSGIY